MARICMIGTLLLASAYTLGTATTASGGPGNAAASRPQVCVLASAESAAAREALQTLERELLALNASIHTTLISASTHSAPAKLPCRQLVVAVGTNAFSRALTDLDESIIVVGLLASMPENIPGTINSKDSETSVTTPPKVKSNRQWVMVSPHPPPALWLDTIRRLLPNSRTIGLVYDSGVTGDLVRGIQAAASERKLAVQALQARDVGEALRAFHRFERDIAVDALILLPDRTTTTRETAQYALELGHWKRLPIMGPSRWYAASGALLALVPRPAAQGNVLLRW